MDMCIKKGLKKKKGQVYVQGVAKNRVADFREEIFLGAENRKGL